MATQSSKAKNSAKNPTKNSEGGDNLTRSLTPRQKELLDFIEKTSSQEHRVPSYREMAVALKVSAVGTVQDLVKALLDKSYLRKVGKHLMLSEKRQSSITHVPIMGVVSAGTLTQSFENSLGVLSFSTQLLPAKKNKRLFALKVQGQSMIEAGIMEGDFVVVNPDLNAQSGDTVVVQLEGESTVKEIFFKSKSVVLHPRNSKMDDIVLDEQSAKDLELLGRVVLVQRIL